MRRINVLCFHLIVADLTHCCYCTLFSCGAILLYPPVKVEFVGQHPPVIAPRLWCVQTSTQLLSDGDRDSKCIWSH